MLPTFTTNIEKKSSDWAVISFTGPKTTKLIDFYYNILDTIYKIILL